MFELFIVFCIVCYFFLLGFFGLTVANIIALIVGICSILFLFHGIAICAYRDTYTKRYRIATDGKTYYIQFLEMYYVYFGKKVWKDKIGAEFVSLGGAKMRLEKLVGLNKTAKEDKSKQRTHVEIDIEHAGIKIPF